MRIDLWETSFQHLLQDKERLITYLSQIEILRAKRFTSPEVQDMHLVMLGYLKEILASYLKMYPQQVEISYNEFGRQVVKGSDINFYMSHSGQRIVVAVSEDVNLSVDIEVIRDIENSDEIVRQQFSQSEMEIYSALPGNRKKASFLRSRVRKEAVMKANGCGLVDSLRNLDVGVLPFQHAMDLEYGGAHFRMFDIQGPDWVGCLVAQTPEPSFEIKRFSKVK